MTSDVAAGSILGTRRFFDDYKGLTAPIARKVLGALQMIRDHGPRHPPLQTRRIAGNSDARFHLMDVDDQYRLVAVLDSPAVLLAKVGNHDETIRWGARASLADYEARWAATAERLAELRERRQRVAEDAPAAVSPELLQTTLSLAEVVAHQEEFSDLISGDVFGALAGYRDGTIEDWMIFLSPLQRKVVDRTIAGPGRVTGGPGTGKSVVALHRAAAFAREPNARVLVTSFVKTVPAVLEGLFDGLAADVRHRVTFRGVDSLAGVVLSERLRWVSPNLDGASSRFARALAADPGRLEAFQRLGLSSSYLEEEVTRVIDGRRVRSLEGYLALVRHGRRRSLNEEARRLVWALAADYRAACRQTDPETVDFSRILSMALDAIEESPMTPEGKFTAIIVDEAQDLTEAGLRLLVHTLRDGPNGRILLVGDSGQRIYPGGYRLSDVGLEIRGRSFVLTECYRSTDEIIRAAGALAQFLSSEEFGDDGMRASELQTTRVGARPGLHTFADPEAEHEWLIGELRAAADLDSTAILVPTNPMSSDWQATLRRAGIPYVDLLRYVGRPTPGVKIGTYNRAKGLEFKQVYLPELSCRHLQITEANLDEAIRRASLLYVAMTRARDRLEMSLVGRLTPLLEPLTPFVYLQPPST